MYIVSMSKSRAQNTFIKIILVLHIIAIYVNNLGSYLSLHTFYWEAANCSFVSKMFSFHYYWTLPQFLIIASLLKQISWQTLIVTVISSQFCDWLVAKWSPYYANNRHNNAIGAMWLNVVVDLALSWPLPSHRFLMHSCTSLILRLRLRFRYCTRLCNVIIILTR